MMGQWGQPRDDDMGTTYVIPNAAPDVIPMKSCETCETLWDFVVSSPTSSQWDFSPKKFHLKSTPVYNSSANNKE